VRLPHRKPPNCEPGICLIFERQPIQNFFSSTLGLQKNMSDASKIETNGVNPVPDNERYGRPFDLFPVWFSWNISIFGITLGIYVFGLGLSVWQAMLAGVIGYFLSCALVGILAVGSVRTGLPTLVQSRLAFGYHGNKLPTFFGYLANMGWKVTLLSMATTTLADLVANLVPGLLNDKGMPVAGCTLGCFAVVLLLTMSGAIYGHQLIIKIEKAIAWLTGIFTIVYLFFFIPNINFSALSSAPSGSFATFVGGIVLSMTMVGLGFLNYGGDYARYLPRKTPARGVIFWTTTGIAVPVSVLLILGVMLAVGNPALLEKANHEPLAALTGILPFWFYVPFSLIVIISLISAGMTGIYSSGLALLALGVPMSGHYDSQRRDHRARCLLSALYLRQLRVDLPVVPRADLGGDGYVGRH
jgi:NCS1 family nucleobase:cation symporter-1